MRIDPTNLDDAIRATNATHRATYYNKLSAQPTNPAHFSNAARTLAALSHAQSNGMEVEWLLTFLSDLCGVDKMDDGELIGTAIFVANLEHDL